MKVSNYKVWCIAKPATGWRQVVVNAGGKSANFSIFYPKPAIFEPRLKSAPSGTTQVTISGFNFGLDPSVIQVTLGSVECNMVTLERPLYSTQKLIVDCPQILSYNETINSVGVFRVTVEGVEAEEAQLPTINNITDGDCSTDKGSPTITSLSPHYIPPHFRVTIFGQNFGCNISVVHITVDGAYCAYPSFEILGTSLSCITPYILYYGGFIVQVGRVYSDTYYGALNTSTTTSYTGGYATYGYSNSGSGGYDPDDSDGDSLMPVLLTSGVAVIVFGSMLCLKAVLGKYREQAANSSSNSGAGIISIQDPVERQSLLQGNNNPNYSRSEQGSSAAKTFSASIVAPKTDVVIEDTKHEDGQGDLILCDICSENNKTMVFNCGHLTCYKCSLLLKTCPFCKTPITTSIKVFL